MKPKFNSSQKNKSQERNWTLKKTGDIPQILGYGEDAKNSLVYLVLKYSFISSLIISVLVVVNYWFFRDSENKVPNITSDLKVIWEILTPIITMALGYSFGNMNK